MSDSDKVTNLKLLASRPEVGNVRTFVFETGGQKWTAGQALGYRLPQAGDTDDDNQRWFTIASAPSEHEIHISTRVSESKFKQSLNALHVGDSIQSFGLEGDFTWEDAPSPPVVLVAGGIGITPFRSILLERSVSGKALNATLLYFNRTEEIPFRSELKALEEKHPEFTMLVVVGEPISADAILEHAPQAKTQTTYLSGPEPMVENVGSGLKERGVQIKQDWFPGYDDKSY